MKDLSQHLWSAPSIDPDTYTATTDGSQVDVHDMGRAAALIVAGAYTDGDHTFDLEHAADDGNGSPDTWESVPTGERVWDEDVSQFDGDGKLLFDEASDSGTYELGYTGDRRFLRVVTSDVSNTSSGATYGAVVLGGDARRSTVDL